MTRARLLLPLLNHTPRPTSAQTGIFPSIAPAFAGRLAWLGVLMVVPAPVHGPAAVPKRKWAEANLPAEFAKYLADLAHEIQKVRLARNERSRPPGAGLMAAALGHIRGKPSYPTREDDRRLMEDLLTVMEQDPEDAPEVPTLRARIVAHYRRSPLGQDHAGGYDA